MRILFSAIVLAALIISGCSNQDPTSKKETMPDSSSGYVDVNGLHMYYETHGSGAPLVLLHGGGSTARTTFGEIIPLLAKHRKVIAVDLQAHGHTSDRSGALTFQQDADDVAALVKALKIDKADFFGFSNGGSTSLQIGIRHPEIVRKLVIASAIYQREGMFPGFFDMMKNANLGMMPAALKEAYLADGNDQAALQNMHDKDAARMVNFRDWSDEEISSIESPVLLISSDKDVVMPEHTVKIFRLLKNAEMIIVPGLHGECINEVSSAKTGNPQPARTVAMVEEFLEAPVTTKQ